MKILLQNSLYWPDLVGGAEQCTMLLARLLRERGHRVDILSTSGRHGRSGELSESPDVDGAGRVFKGDSHGLYDLIDLGDRRPGILVRGLHHYAAVHSPRWRRLALGLLRDLEPEVLHTNSLVGQTPALWEAAAGLGVPVVHTLHDFHLLCPRNTLLRSSGADCLAPPLPCRILSRLKLAATHRVRAVTAPSRFHLDRHLQAGGFPRARAEVVPNAIDDLPGRVPDRPLTGPVRGLFLGVLEPHKGIDLLLSALDRAFASDRFGDLEFDFAGRGSAADRVREFCLRHEGRARFHGYVDGEAKRGLLAGAHLAVVPSTCQDNSPRTVLDALAWGSAVIASRRGGIPELVEDGREGFLIEPGDEDLLAALARYVEDRALLAEHGLAARRRAGNFTPDRHAGRFEEIYRSVAGSPQDPALQPRLD
ncbi:MAG: glycosyltransferase family 4 protein [Candidatus Krumholzibacteriia bacterium]